MIRTKKAHLPVAAITHEGKRGKNNEDRFAISSYKLDSMQGSLPVLLSVVSDGVGGHRAGEVASEMTVNTISNYVQQSDGKHPQAILSNAIRAASNQIFALGQTTSDFEGMGATVACILIIGHRLYSATVGDSRIYLMRSGHAQQISVDHTWVQEALTAGIISPSEIAGHPNQHVIRRYLGSSRPQEVDFRIRLFAAENDTQSENNQGMPLVKGDRLLICSDGLSDLVSGEEMISCLNGQSLESALKSLVDLANERGGHDNITISVVEVPTDRPFFEPLFTDRHGSLVMVSLAGVSGIILLIFAGWYLFSWLTSNAALLQLPTTFLFNQPTSLDQKLTPQKGITITLDPKISFDQMFFASPTATYPFHVFGAGENTLTPWPTNTWTPTSMPSQSSTPGPNPRTTSTGGSQP